MDSPDRATPRRDLARLCRVAAKRSEYDAEVIDLCERLRLYDPPVPWARLAACLGFRDEAGVINMMRRAGRLPETARTGR